MAHNHDRSPEQIEQEIEQERSALSHTLENLQHRLSFDNMFGGVAESVKEHGGEIGHQAVRKVKENPMAIALAGVGIAWMILGNRNSGQDTGHDMDRRGYGARPMGYDGGDMRSSTLRDPSDRDAGDFTRRVAKADSEMRSQASGTTGRYSAPSYAGTTAGHSGETGEMPEGPGIWTRTSDAVKGKAQHLLSRISEGTEDMSTEARERVMRARVRAYEAQRHAEDTARRAKSSAIDFYDRQPLVAGALALATGALIGSLLPRTQREDEAFGTQSDHLFDEARRVYEEEKVKAQKVYEAAKDEATAIAREARDETRSSIPDGKSVVESVEAKAKSSAKRVADAAKSEADKQKLGKI
ncbi:hypothetical protein BV394_12430 [Brevirhabdus pacifica]|uniref:Uncharacterized protein n=1 Tax=Brevirhabdus pacifica TaxID=1267768 RepID=A0A1U7DKA7_9RHOB|nr:DUF3618 domain-containing protein [Brevirhabdus pacifica]APX90434.1 hypothetical protein BV394_12430 [Brevirhabdus pacifica]OWU78546.1 hypothetical protein ATO5_07035 [Loktanella sp. 22II-4b]PJJ85468.1 uncharacterized protein DUF3618 [Brevirhabdus pacifica]